MNKTLVDPQRLHELVDQHLIQDMQRSLVLGVAEGYRTTWSSAEVFEDEVRVQAWRYARWNGIDSAILSVGKRFASAGVKAAYVANTCETDVRHTELTVGPLVITVACVQSREELPRDAAYRAILAETNQMQLFSVRSKHPDKLWIPLLHIPNPAKKLPRDIFFAFPDGSGGTAADHLDLLARYPIDGVESERIADEAEPTRRIVTETGA